MYKKVITYTNYDGKEEQTVAYFNLTKTECVDLNLEFEEDGGLIGRIKKLVGDRNGADVPRKPAVDFIRLLIDRSYGVRPADNPSLFLKEDDNGNPLIKKFRQSAAYDAYVYALLSGEESLEDFATNVLPQVSAEQKAEAKKLLREEGVPENLIEG